MSSGKRRGTGQHQLDRFAAVDRISELPKSLISQILSLLDMKDAVKTSVISKRWRYSWTLIVDRISELPDSLIGHILSFLDMNDAVKISVLSKRWTHCWTHVVDRDVFVFNCGSFGHTPPSAEILEQFLLFVDRILKQCTCTKIKKFSLTGIVWFRQFSFPVGTLVDKWFDVLIGKEVEVLKLGLWGLNCDIPARFYNSSSLVRLEIDGVGKRYGGGFASIVSLELDNNDFYYYEKTFDVCWNKLKILSLKSVYVKDRFMVEILLGCPMLETLVLDRVEGLREINIKSPSVCELKLLHLYSPYLEGDSHCMEITAPWIEKLEVSGIFDGMDCNLVCVSSLKSANLTLSYDGKYNNLNDYDGFVPSNLIDKLLEPVCDVVDIVIGAELLQALSVSQLTSKHSLVFKCKYLEIHSRISMHEVPGIACLLESSPNLETLVVRVMPWQRHRSMNDDFLFFYDNTYNAYIKELFTSFDGVDYLGRQKQKLLCLKNIKIDCRKKSYSCDQDQSSDNKCFELEIAAYIIRQAPFLEKLVILSSKSNCFSCGALYFSILSSKRKVGEKASRWELKKTDTTYEFIFSP